MTSNSRTVVWDLETADADDLFSYGKGFIRLIGYRINDEDTVVTTDVNELVDVLVSADRHYSFNGLAFDCVAVSLEHGVDYFRLTENAVDLMLVERQKNPPRAKTSYPKGYWGLDQTAKRYGHQGKTDDLDGLARKYGGFDKIPVDDPDFVHYLHGDIEATKFLADRIGGEFETDPYLPREHQVMRRMYYGARLKGFRVDVTELDHRLEMQRIRKQNNLRKLEEKFEIPLKKREVTVFTNPFRVTEGKDWFEKKCVELGVEELVPRTAKGAVSLTVKSVEKILDGTSDPQAQDFFSCVLGAMEDTDPDALKYLNEEFDLPLQREEVIVNKLPLRTSEGKEKLEEWFTRLGASRVYRTEKTKEISTNRKHLEKAVEFYSDEPRQRDARMTPMTPENLELFRELVEVVIDVTSERTVYQTIRDHLHGEYVYPKIIPKQASGRWSVTEPGLTVMGKKKGKWVEREVFLPDSEDEVIIAVDLDQVDARAIAGHSQDPEYAKLFDPGSDMHSEVAKMVFGRCDGEWREKAKILGHGINYGLGPVGAAAQAGVDQKIAYQFYENYTRNFPVLEQWKTSVRDQATHGFFLDNGFGRNMKADPERAYTQAPALSGQGATRDIIGQWVLNLDMDCVRRLRAVVHDEGAFSVPRDRWQEYADRIVAAATFEFRGVPITAGCSKPGDTWGSVYSE